jgi:predicted outer membrane repeat protein
MKKLYFLLVTSLFLAIPCAAQVIIIVDANGTGDYSTIQAAINAANNGDIVELQPGTYTGDGNRDISFLGKAITVQSIDPNDPCVVEATVIDCNGNSDNYHHRGFLFDSGEGSDSVLSGLTITNGYFSDGGAIYCYNHSSPTISNCVIRSNYVTWKGGGIACYGSSPTIRHCTITDNQAAMHGGGICSSKIAGQGYPLTEPILINCTFIGNSASFDGGGMYNYYSTSVLTNCMFIANVAGDDGGGMANPSSNSTIKNCTFSSNSAVDKGGAINYGTSIISHSIFWSDTAGNGSEISDRHTIVYSNVQGGVLGEGNIDADPCFVDPAIGDYHLLANSPCIGAGDINFIPQSDHVDIDGEPRVMGNRVDMGADEFTSTPATIIDIWPTKFEFHVNTSNPDPGTQLFCIRRAGAGMLSWQVAEDCDWLQISPTSGESFGETNEVTLSIDASDLVVNSYNCELTITADGAVNSPRTVPVILYFYVPGQFHVPSRYATIQEAINAAEDGDTITVADGIYTGPGNRDIEFYGKAITVRSEHGPQNCIIDCDGTALEPHRGFTFYSSGEDANSVINGFTITGGYIPADLHAIFPPENGGAIYCYEASPTIKNCIIKANTTEVDGGGIYIFWGSESSTSYITNCIITDNYAHNSGGGIWTDDYVSIRNSIISNNVTGGNGGGVNIPYISQEINNCTIVNNSAAGSGGSIFAGGGWYEWELNVANSIFWDNNAPQGSEISLRNDKTPPDSPPTELTVSYSNVRGETNNIYVEAGCILNWGQGNINKDPCFVNPNANDYHIFAESVCINSGDPNFIPIFREKDIDGEPRIVDGRVDIGADEFAYIGDLNFDGSVDMVDLGTFASELLATNCNDTAGDETDWCSGTDINQDTRVDFRDFAQLAQFWLADVE